MLSRLRTAALGAALVATVTLAPFASTASNSAVVNSSARAHEQARRVAPPPVVPDITGFDVVMMGHSFFIPVVAPLAQHAADAGLNDHTQFLEFSGGSGGAPIALWNNPSTRARIQAALDGGGVDLVGMTYHPDHPGVEGYQRWIDEALVANADTSFFVGFPWLPSPTLFSSASYRSTWLDAYDTVALELIDELRALYPDVEIFAVPYGRAAAELFALFDAGSLPDVSALVSRDGDGIFVDGFGHAGPILQEVASLVVLRAIYGIEVSSDEFDSTFSFDTRALADAIIDVHDPGYNRR